MRREEYLDCINRIVANETVDRLHILSETDDVFNQKKVVIIRINTRPTYNMFFDITRKTCSEGDIIIIANADVYPLDSLEILNQMRLNEAYALSRWEKTPSGYKLLDRRDSQDVWIFRAPVRDISGDFSMGIPGCDNRLAFKIEKVGYDVTNPSKTIRFGHLHLSNLRNYDKSGSIKGRYKLIEPTALVRTGG